MPQARVVERERVVLGERHQLVDDCLFGGRDLVAGVIDRRKAFVCPVCVSRRELEKGEIGAGWGELAQTPVQQPLVRVEQVGVPIGWDSISRVADVQIFGVCGRRPACHNSKPLAHLVGLGLQPQDLVVRGDAEIVLLAAFASCTAEVLMVAQTVVDRTLWRIEAGLFQRAAAYLSQRIVWGAAAM